LVIRIIADSLRAVGGNDVDPIDDLGVVAMRSDKARQDVQTLTGALGASHPYDRQLADKVTKDNCAIARHIAAIRAKKPAPSSEGISDAGKMAQQRVPGQGMARGKSVIPDYFRDTLPFGPTRFSTRLIARGRLDPGSRSRTRRRRLQRAVDGTF
jgi:hypothetical protein